MSDTGSNKAVVRAFVDVVNARDWAQLGQLVSPAFVRHSDAAGPSQTRSRADLEQFLQAEFRTFPDGQEVIEDMVAEGDRVAVRHRFQGTQTGPLGRYPASGRVLTAQYLAIYRLADGVIAEAWAEWDNLAGLTQLGHYRQQG